MADFKVVFASRLGHPAPRIALKIFLNRLLHDNLRSHPPFPQSPIDTLSENPWMVYFKMRVSIKLNP
jgi:hypothetical protein